MGYVSVIKQTKKIMEKGGNRYFNNLCVLVKLFLRIYRPSRLGTIRVYLNDMKCTFL